MYTCVNVCMCVTMCVYVYMCVHVCIYVCMCATRAGNEGGGVTRAGRLVGGGVTGAAD